MTVQGTSQVNNYSEELIDFIKFSEDFVEKPNGYTVGHGFDYYIRDDIKINYQDDGTITEDAALDLFYKRNSNALTQEVIVAMANRDDEQVKDLFSDFPSRYANKYLYNSYTDPDERVTKIQEWLDRNLDGLNNRIRREIEIYQNGYSDELYK